MRVGIAITYTICALVWGTTWFAIRQCIGPEGYPTLPAAALRFSIAAALLISLTQLFRLKPGASGAGQRAWLALAGILNGIGYALVYRGEESVSGGLAAVLFGTMPLFAALVAHVFRIEVIRPGHVVGSLISLCGIALIFGDRLSASARQGAGIALIVGAVVVSALYSAVLKEHTRHLHPLRGAATFVLVTAVTLWIISAAFGGGKLPWPPPVRPTVALLYLAIMGSVFTFASYIYLLKRVRLMTVMTLVFVQPTIALIVDALWEHEIMLTGSSYLGIAITMTGVAASLLWNRRMSSPAG